MDFAPTARFYDQLLPLEPEVLPDRQPAQAWATTRFDPQHLPGATRDAVIHFLAMFLLFTVIRNNLASVRHL